MITIENLNFGYSDQKILAIPRLEIGKARHWAVLGKSGSGKTTLLHILGGLLEPKHGKVTIGGTDLYRLSGNRRDRFRGQNIGLVFQKNHLIRALNVQDNLFLAQYLAGVSRDKQRVREVLNELNLHDKMTARVKELSQGQQQRVAIARALLNKPQVILADEPTASLDHDHAHLVIGLLKSQATRYEASLILATHDQRVKDAFPLQLNLDT